MPNELNNEERLLRAAENVFLIKGFAGAKTTDIAAQAGMTHTMLHYYFRTKEQLFNRVIGEKIAILSQMVEVFSRDKQKPIKDRIRSMVERHFDILAQNPLLPRFLINIINEKPELLHQVSEAIDQMAEKICIPLQNDLDKAAANGEICAIKVTDLFFNIISVNFFTFIGMPVGKKVLKLMHQDDSDYLAIRREENVKIILKRIEL